MVTAIAVKYSGKLNEEFSTLTTEDLKIQIKGILGLNEKSYYKT